MTYDHLLPYAIGPKQAALIEALVANPEWSIPKAAAELGMDKSNACRAVRAMRSRATLKDDRPDEPTKTLLDPLILSGDSTLYDAEGNTKLRWVKTKVDPQRMEEMVREVLDAMASEIPREEPVSAVPTAVNADLCSLYVLTDFHLGMMAWGEETKGADWDIKIAEDLMVKWFARAIELAPPSEYCVLAQLGDFLHWDGFDAVTPASKHLLDADTRWPKLTRVAIRVMRRVIGMLLAKHQHVHLIVAEGNHDPSSSVVHREWLNVLYELEPRVTVDTNPDAYYCYEFGSTGLFFHHGHKAKMAKVDTVFVGKFREIFGRTKYAEAHLGHLHSERVLETNLMRVEQHPTLAAQDAYASKGPWASERAAKVITYHREHGRVMDTRITPEML